MNLFSAMYFSRRFAMTAKKILPIVFVSAIGRNSAGPSASLTLRIDAVAHSAGTSLVFHTFLKDFHSNFARQGIV